MFLVDTSLWVCMFRHREPWDPDRFVAWDEIVTCGPVIQEVLGGFKDNRAYRLARDAMLDLPRVESPAPFDLFVAAADLYRLGRRAGVRIRTAADCLIAACALRNDLTVVHDDADFEHLARIAPLDQRRIRT